MKDNSGSLTFTVLNNKTTQTMTNSNKVRKSGYLKYTQDFLDYFEAYSEMNPKATKAQASAIYRLKGHNPMEFTNKPIKPETI